MNLITHKSASQSFIYDPIGNLQKKEVANPNIMNNLFFNMNGHQNRIINPNANKFDQMQLFLTYLYGSKSANPADNFLFNQISKLIAENFSLIEIDITRFQSLISTNKWKNFEQEHFSYKGSQNNYYYGLTYNQNGEIKILLAGKKFYIAKAKQKIESFLETNELKNKIMRLNEDEMIYFKYVSINLKNELEDKYDIHINLKENTEMSTYYLLLTDVPKYLVEKVEQSIKDELASKQIKYYSTEYLPGLSYVFNEKETFKHEVARIAEETNTYITSKLNMESSENGKNSSNSLSKQIGLLDMNVVVPSAPQNEIKHTVTIGKSKITLEIGNIINTKAEVIVNTTASNLNLNCGAVSKLIYECAGPEILDECKQNYPNGIKPGEIAMTSAGKFDYVKYLFHITCLPFSNLVDSGRLLCSLLLNCLFKLDENNMSEISFPPIGTGALKYPADLFVKWALNCVIWFFEKHSDKSFNVKFVLHEKDVHLIEGFDKELTEMKKYFDPNLKEINEEKPKAQVSFKVISKDEESFLKAQKLLQELISKNHIIKDELNSESVKLLTKDEVAELSNKFKNCEIYCENTKLTFYGYKEDVLSAKIEATLFINDKIIRNNTEFEKKLSVSKDIQWLYEHQKDDWRPFSLFINSSIESAFLNKNSHVCFTTEESQPGIIYFNIKPNFFCTKGQRYNIRRVEISKYQEQIQYPSNWANVNDEDFNLIDLQFNTAEFMDVLNDFIAKFDNKLKINYIRIQRVQNKSLYKQYLVHKEKLAKNSRANELSLYHGSNEENINMISKFGFNRSLCGTNGISYGQGVYFAVNSAYSNNFAKNPNSTIRKMIKSRVLVGESCLGNSSMREPPKKPNGEPYDSTTDQNKQVFVCYHDNQCYPEYIISYSIN